MSETRDHVYGVDFSGAKNAGKHIWIAGGVIQGDALRIDTCRRADRLPKSSTRRDECLAALHAFIVDKSESAFGNVRQSP